MTFLDKYTEATLDTAQYPEADERTVSALLYVTLGLAGEVGEVANQVKKIVRDDLGIVTGDRQAKLVDEVGDVFWYLFSLCRELGVDPEDAMRANMNKLRQRMAENTIHGDRRES